ncbi:hypothetical protein SUDANB120_02883 [Streptomyces sp. enrichment culture]|nr:hypothetical protein GCM10010286_28390 [Streptomyces toxytricini]
MACGSHIHYPPVAAGLPRTPANGAGVGRTSERRAGAAGRVARRPHGRAVRRGAHGARAPYFTTVMRFAAGGAIGLAAVDFAR